MNDQRPENAIDIFGLCVKRLAESLENPPRDERDYTGIVEHFEMAFEQGYKGVLQLLMAHGS